MQEGVGTGSSVNWGMQKSMLLTLLLAYGTAQAESIPLIREHGTFVVPVVINDEMPLISTIDSGASDAAGSLLLGQSLLSRLKSWSIDNQRQVLLINESPPSMSGKVAPHPDTNNQGTDWIPLPLVNDRVGQVFVNIASIRVDGNLRWFRDKRIDPPHPDNSEIKWINYTVTRWEINCDEQLVKLDEQTKYYEDGTRWVAGSDLLSLMQWIAVKPNTAMEGEMKIVCAWKPN
jgi:hypothetical protein